MKSLHLDLGLLLWAMSWHVPEVSSNLVAAFERTVLLSSEELPQILRHWHLRPASHGSGILTHHQGTEAIAEFAISLVERIQNSEIVAFAPYVHLKAKDVTRASLLSLDIELLLEKAQELCPVTWRLKRSAMWTNRQEEHALIKTPDFVSHRARAIFVSCD
jgi:hypothetical protein